MVTLMPLQRVRESVLIDPKLNIQKTKEEENLLNILTNKLKQFFESFVIFQFSLFQKIQPSEFYDCNWTKPNKKEISPNISNISKYFNTISDWIISQVLLESSAENRAKLLELLIEIGRLSIENGAFHCAVQIYSIISNKSITRLKTSWSLVNSNSLKHKEHLVSVVSSSGNYSNLRRMSSIANPCFPYIGILLSDYLFIDEGNPKYKNGLINFSKLSAFSYIFVFLKETQLSVYHFVCDPLFENLFLTCTGLSAEQAEEILKVIK